MAMSVTYTTIGGVIVHEALSGNRERELTADPLGSLVKIRTSVLGYSYSAEYWPYGEIQSQTGSNPTRRAFVGLLGYMRDLATMFYVRARYCRAALTRWMTVEPLWPDEAAYLYCGAEPVLQVDPQGAQSCTAGNYTFCFGKCALSGGIRRCQQNARKQLVECSCRKPPGKVPPKGKVKVPLKGKVAAGILALLPCIIEAVKDIFNPSPAQRHDACMQCCQTLALAGCTAVGGFFGGPPGIWIGIGGGTAFGHLGGCQKLCDCLVYDKGCNSPGGSGIGGGYFGGGSIVRGEGTSNPKWD